MQLYMLWVFSSFYPIRVKTCMTNLDPLFLIPFYWFWIIYNTVIFNKHFFSFFSHFPDKSSPITNACDNFIFVLGTDYPTARIILIFNAIVVCFLSIPCMFVDCCMQMQEVKGYTKQKYMLLYVDLRMIRNTKQIVIRVKFTNTERVKRHQVRLTVTTNIIILIQN